MDTVTRARHGYSGLELVYGLRIQLNQSPESCVLLYRRIDRNAPHKPGTAGPGVTRVLPNRGGRSKEAELCDRESLSMWRTGIAGVSEPVGIERTRD